jgi:hypothetical protein
VAREPLTFLPRGALSSERDAVGARALVSEPCEPSHRCSSARAHLAAEIVETMIRTLIVDEDLALIKSLSPAAFG